MPTLKDLARLTGIPEEAWRTLRNPETIPSSEEQPPDPREVLSINGAAVRFRLHTRTVSRWVASGLVTVVQRGTSTRPTLVSARSVWERARVYREGPGRGRKTAYSA